MSNVERSGFDFRSSRSHSVPEVFFGNTSHSQPTPEVFLHNADGSTRLPHRAKVGRSASAVFDTAGLLGNIFTMPASIWPNELQLPTAPHGSGSMWQFSRQWLFSKCHHSNFVFLRLCIIRRPISPVPSICSKRARSGVAGSGTGFGSQSFTAIYSIATTYFSTAYTSHSDGSPHTCSDPPASARLLWQSGSPIKHFGYFIIDAIM